MRFVSDRRSGLLIPDMGRRQRGFFTCGPALFGSGGSGPSSYQAVILADSPISYWRLNDTAGSTSATDLGSNAKTGTYSGTCTLSQSSLLPNGQGASVLFGGGSVILPADTTRGVSPCSVEFWFNSSNVTSTSVPFESVHSTPSLACSLGTTANKIQLSIPTVGNLTPSTAVINASTTYHCIGTLDGSGNYNYYINGVAAGSFTGASSTSGGLTSGFIASDSGSFTFSGKIQEVAIYNYVLSATQAAAHYAAGN